MTEQEFKQKLDQVVTEALNTVGVATVYGQLCTVKQFVEVVYDASVVESINAARARAMQQMQTEQTQEKTKVEGESA